MSYTPSPLETLFLWRLLASGDGEFLKYIKPDPGASQRRRLKEAGLIETESRRDARPGKRPARSTYISLSEKGWEWAANHLDAKVSERSTAAGPILQEILARLKSHLQSQDYSLADFISGHCQSQSSHQGYGEDLHERVRAAYFLVTGGRANVRARLADLREQLADVTRKELDESLLAMERQGIVILYPLDNPQEIHPQDEQAALANAVGTPRHIVYMET